MTSPPPEPEHLPGLRTFPWRFAVYGLVLLYLAGDLYVFRGPFRRSVERMRGTDPGAVEVARREGIVATANGLPIRREEVALAVDEYCLRRGLDRDALPRERVNAIRVSVIDQLVVDRLLWFHAKQTPVALPDAAVADELARLRGAFPSDEALQAAAAARGFAAGQLEIFLESQAMQSAWVEAKIAQYIAVEEPELRARYEDLGADGEEPGATFDEMREELKTALETEKRQWAVDGLIGHLRRDAVIRYFREYFWVE